MIDPFSKTIKLLEQTVKLESHFFRKMLSDPVMLATKRPYRTLQQEKRMDSNGTD